MYTLYMIIFFPGRLIGPFFLPNSIPAELSQLHILSIPQVPAIPHNTAGLVVLQLQTILERRGRHAHL